MERNIEHFEQRLDKETYSNEEVAKMLHNEATFTASKTKKEFEGYVSAEDFQGATDKVNDLQTKLNPYVEAEHNQVVDKAFATLNGNADRVGDFKSIGGITPEMDNDAIVAKATELKESGKYDFMFNKVNSGGNKLPDAPSKPITKVNGAITPSTGLNWFKKKK